MIEKPQITPEYNGQSKETTDIADENGFVWRVAPTLAYEGIYYCSEAGEFDTENHSGNKLDPATGQVVSVCQTGHGGYDRNLLYNEKLNQFGYHGNDEGDEYFEMWPWHEFIHENPHYSSRLNVFQKVDSDKVIESRQLFEGSWRTTFDLRDAVSSEKCAVAFGISFLSDFIFELDRSYDVDSVYGHVNSYIAIKYDDKWGILDSNGTISVPFVFDAILLIDEETAFAKYNGKYGILDIEKTAESAQRLINAEDNGGVSESMSQLLTSNKNIGHRYEFIIPPHIMLFSAVIFHAS